MEALLISVGLTIAAVIIVLAIMLRRSELVMLCFCASHI